MIKVLVFFFCVIEIFGDFISDFNSYPNRMQIIDSFETRELLEKYKPKVYVSKNSYMPISFYKDYLPNTKLKKSSFFNKVINDKTSKKDLYKYAKNSEYFLDLGISYKEAIKKRVGEITPTFYGRVYSDTLKSENGDLDLIFLKYNFCFPYSGLPSSLKLSQKIITRLVKNRFSWHELDIHGAVHIVLNGNSREVLGVLINQHNHHKSYVKGLDFLMPLGNRLEIVISEYSNEPYLYLDKSGSYEKTAGLPKELAYLYGNVEDGGILAAKDYLPSIEEALEVEMEIEILKEGDPLYNAEMLLGKKEKLFGLIRLWYLDGPPGIDYYSLPELKNLADLFSFWYLKPEDDEFFELWKEEFKKFPNVDLTKLKVKQNNLMYLRLVNKN